MDLTRKEYAEYVKKASPNSPLVRDLLGAFLIGGTICTIGQGIMWLLERWGVPEEQARPGNPQWEAWKHFVEEYRQRYGEDQLP